MPRLSLEERYEIAILATMVNEFGEKINSYGSVAVRMGVSKSTVYSIAGKYNNGEELVDRPRSGRPRVLTQGQKDAILRRVRNHPFQSVREISRGIRHVPSRQTVNRFLISEGISSYTPAFKTRLTREQQRQRLRWAREFKDYDIGMWRKVLFTDETYIDLGSGPGRIRVRRPIGERYNQRYLQATRLPYKGGFKIMFWGGIRHGKLTHLYPFRERMTSQVYADFLEETLIPDLDELIDDGYVFMDDNATPHRARRVDDVKENNNLDVLPWWPAASADLNPIENVWGLLKERVRRREPNRWNLEQITIEEWYNLEWEIINSVIDSMPTRIRLVIRARGGPIKY
jgi:transposase